MYEPPERSHRFLMAVIITLAFFNVATMLRGTYDRAHYQRELLMVNERLGRVVELCNPDLRPLPEPDARARPMPGGWECVWVENGHVIRRRPADPANPD